MLGGALGSFEELIDRYARGEITEAEFFGDFLWLVDEHCVGVLIDRLPRHLQGYVVADAASLQSARLSGEELIDFTHGAPKPDASCEAAMFAWLNAHPSRVQTLAEEHRRYREERRRRFLNRLDDGKEGPGETGG